MMLEGAAGSSWEGQVKYRLPRFLDVQRRITQERVLERVPTP